jgi:small subunit ribosomal protein S8
MFSSDEGYIRGYTEIEKDGHKNLEIELKYYEGHAGHLGDQT